MRPLSGNPTPRVPISRRTAMLAPVLLSFAIRRASAHAVIVSSIPPAGGTVRVGEVVFTLRFNSRVDHARSRLVLMGPDGNQTVLTIDPPTDYEVMTATAIVTAGGQSLHWQVLATDGHITRGDIPFKAVRN